MKKLISALIAIFISVGAFSQFSQYSKGRFLIGGNLGFNSTTSKTKLGSNSSSTSEKSNMFSFTPQLGYFLINNLSAGMGLDISLSSVKPTADIYDEYNTSIQFQPFVRYYIKPGIFFQGTYGIGSEKDKQTYNGDSQQQKYMVYSWSAAAGYSLLINNRVAIEPLIGYGSKTSKDNSTSQTSRYIDSGLFIKLGFQVYLRD
jgi:outer membrane protein